MAKATPAQLKAAIKKLSSMKSVQSYIKLRKALDKLEVSKPVKKQVVEDPSDDTDTIAYQSEASIKKRSKQTAALLKKGKALTPESEFSGGYISAGDISLKKTSENHYYVIDNANDDGADDSVSESQRRIIGAVYRDISQPKNMQWQAFMGTVAEICGAYKSKDIAAKSVFYSYRG